MIPSYLALRRKNGRFIESESSLPMCGIAGIIAEREELVHEALPKMVTALTHRGPDDEGTVYRPFRQGFVGLGFRRLSIIDLTLAGHQPMSYPDSGSCLVFNGEIYNFPCLRKELEQLGQRFVGHSDSEVLLQALERWGPSCLARLQGMYAFAWLDGKSQRLILARDPMGMKPLYVYRRAGLLVFASEIRALLASGLVPRKLDRQGLAGLLAYGAVQQPCTIVKGVQAFPGGHWEGIEATEQPSRPTPFFHFPKLRSDAKPDDAVESLRGTLSKAVRDHLISDVPVGIFLSSGLDSTVIAALASQHTQRMRSFTVGFADQQDMSESQPASQTAALLGLDHTEIQINEPEAQEQVLDWLKAVDQPSVDGLNIYIISRAVRKAGIKVALSGLGGDELFGGYPSFVDVPRLQRLHKRVTWLPHSVRRALFTTATLYRSRPVRDKIGDIGGSNGSLVNLFLHRRRALPDRDLAALGLKADELGLEDNFQPAEALAGLAHDCPDPVWQISQLETRFYQGNMLLPDGDANSMAHGLELRLPMLDQRVLELVLPLPGSVRLPNGRANKHLLRKAFGRSLWAGMAGQKKRGFTLPIFRWMSGALRTFSENSLDSLKQTGFLRPEGITDIWNGYLREPDSPMWSRAFTLIVLGEYLRKTELN
ncbi:MAG: asparagine synthase (glutamine-hydrolyzing) [Gemmataceae bacterium]